MPRPTQDGEYTRFAGDSCTSFPNDPMMAVLPGVAWRKRSLDSHRVDRFAESSGGTVHTTVASDGRIQRRAHPGLLGPVEAVDHQHPLDHVLDHPIERAAA